MINFKLVGKRIKNLRHQENITQEALAERINISTEHLSRIETGYYRPSIKLIENICEIFGIEEKTLLFGDEKVAASKNADLLERINQLSEEKRKALDIIVDLIS